MTSDGLRCIHRVAVPSPARTSKLMTNTHKYCALWCAEPAEPYIPTCRVIPSEKNTNYQNSKELSVIECLIHLSALLCFQPDMGRSR